MTNRSGEIEVLAEYGHCQELFGGYWPAFLESYQSADLVERIPQASLQTPTAQAQQELFNRLCRAVAEGRLHIAPDLHVLREQLLSMEIDTGRARSFRRVYCRPVASTEPSAHGVSWG